MTKLLLFGTQGCHLCELAEELIEAFQANELGLLIERIDIAEHEQWQKIYAIRIPVLLNQETGKELGWPFDYSDLEKLIATK